MIQYKLLEVLDSYALNELKNEFNNNDIYLFTDNIIGIKYDFSSNSYSDILKRIIGINLRQWTITSTKFLKIIEYAVKNNIFLGSVNFLEFIDDYTIEFIRDQILSINNTNNIDEKETIMHKLFNYLKWLTLDECIDVKSILIKYEVDRFPFNIDVTFFNNGVLYINDETTPAKLKELILKLSIEG
ncbi:MULTISPECIES: hypothetical protein [unclassified Clostridioides]|uniref:hypothetical protein n=1 Tax=unclassified Clostridioides TaxID=2635829 RepID=UPI001D12ABA8|nr:hypothetical protein [Clostridioides sp. ZZV15-6388]MCC0719081.1 hypothetical protein [Clostridioides sp. ZZV14-6105]